MIGLAKAATDAEIAEAAAYFSSLKPRQNTRVVETDTAPKTYVTFNHYVALTTGEKEPLGKRIVEVAENFTQFENRDTHTRFVAYVPVGSIARGQALVTTGGNGRTVACGTCHGAELKGLGPVPPLAGRSPSYAVRQMFDLQHGTRRGSWSPLMAGAVQKLTLDDMVAIAAYLASRAP